MNAEEFLRALFTPAPKESRVLIRKGGNLSHYELAGDIPSFNANEEWFFGVLPRDSKGAIPLATTVWADVDHPSESYDLNAINPVPSVIVSSGGGYHVYWFLSEAIDSASAVRLAKLARIAVDGDKAVCEPARQLRIPGTLNAKYTPPRTVSILRETEARYSERQLTQELIASVVATVWEDGQRHALALALGAVLARGGWGAEESTQIVRRICEITNDKELHIDRIPAALGTLVRREEGLRVSAAELRDSLGAKEFQVLCEAMGVTARDGDVIHEGQVVGGNTDADLCRVIYEDSLWSREVGGVARWDGQCWSGISSKDVDAQVFDTLNTLKMVKKGEEFPLAISVQRARSIASMAEGHFLHLGEPNPNLLPLENGALDMLTRELLPHAPEHNNRWIIPIVYDPEAKAPRWQQYLTEVVESEIADFLQEWFAYCFIPGNPHQVMLWLLGKSGTGKSRIPLLLEKLFSHAVTAINFDNLNEKTLAILAKVSVATSGELSIHTMNTTLFKSLVAGDLIQARQLYKEPFSFIFRGKFIIASNNLPPLDDSEGMARRLHIVEFKKVIPKEQQDGKLIDKFVLELPGILNWALEAMPRLRSYEVWPLPEGVAHRVQESLRGADVLTLFMEELLEFDRESFLSDSEISFAYRAWCEARGIKPRPFDVVFRYHLEKCGLVPTMVEYISGFRGAKLRAQIFDGRR